MSVAKILKASLLILTALLTFSCKEKYIETVVTDKRIDLSATWQELVPPRPLRCDSSDQEILLYSPTPHSVSVHPLGMELEDGTVVRPEAQLVGEDGKTYELTDLSLWGEAVVLSSKALPRSSTFNKLRIRSDKPIQLSKVSFNCYNFKDVKR